MEIAYRLVEIIARPLLDFWFKWEIRGLENLSDTPRILASNHASYLDPFAIALVLHSVGMRARFLAKAELFNNPFLRVLLNSMGQIPVYRGTSAAGGALKAAEEAVAGGRTVVVFPESTIGPGLPLLALKSGTARLAIATQQPITPIAVWGGQNFISIGTRNLRRGQTITVEVGEPIQPRSDPDPQSVDDLTAELAVALTKLTESASRTRND